MCVRRREALRLRRARLHVRHGEPSQTRTCKHTPLRRAPTHGGRKEPRTLCPPCRRSAGPRARQPAASVAARPGRCASPRGIMVPWGVHVPPKHSLGPRSPLQADSGALVRHVRVHSGLRPALCTWPNCDYSGTDHSNLARHYITHLGVRPFTCPEPSCTYAAAQKCSLDSHVSRRHTRSRDHPCPGEGCEYAAYHSGDLRAHCKRCSWPGAGDWLLSTTRRRTARSSKVNSIEKAAMNAARVSTVHQQPPPHLDFQGGFTPDGLLVRTGRSFRR